MFKSKEYKYFDKKLVGVQYAIWDNEFKRFKTLEIREEIRKEYDNLKSLVLATKDKMNKQGVKKEEVEKMKDIIDKQEVDITRYQEQVKGLDKEVHGAKPTAEEPNGADGIDQIIDSLYELKDMIRDYMIKL